MATWTDENLIILNNAEDDQYIEWRDPGDPSNQSARLVYNCGTQRLETRISDENYVVVTHPNNTTNIGFNTTSPSYTCHVNGTFYASGSSRAFKENIEDLTVDSSLIYELNPVSYDYKVEHKAKGYDLPDGTKQIGLIAEDVVGIIPEIAILDAGKVSNVDYQKITVLLIEEVKKLNNRLEKLEGDE
jgi:hypothetical protein